MKEIHQEVFERLRGNSEIGESLQRLADDRPDVITVFLDLFLEHPSLEAVAASLFLTYRAIVRSYDQDGTLFVCGNGGSFADALHITGELLKSFEKNRHLSPEEQEPFANLPYGEEISKQLEHGLRAIPLGNNTVLGSAVQNDFSLDKTQYAQELYALGRTGDVLIGISTSGNARNVLYTVTTAKAKGMKTIALTGGDGGELARNADIAIRVPASQTRKVQELHLPVYHTLCLMLEARYFPAARRTAQPPRGSILDVNELAEVVDQLKTQGKRIVWTNGCFDILHMGHVTYLRNAKQLGDILIVGINSDESVRAIKGPDRPIIAERQRSEVLSSLDCVDYVTIFSDTDTVCLLERLQPHIYAKGGDYDIDSIDQEERSVVEDYGGEIRILPAVQDTSTSGIIRRIANGAARSDQKL